MSQTAVSITGITTSESAAVKLAGNDQAGLAAWLRSLHIQQASGSGTQWDVNVYRGWTADKTNQWIDTIRLPATAGDLAGAGSDEAGADPDKNKRLSTLESDFAAGWTSSVPKAGLGIYVTATQLAGSGTDVLTATFEIGGGERR